MGSLIQLYHWLGWTGGPWERPVYWKTTLEQKNYKYRIFLDEAGKVCVEPRVR